MSYSLSVYAKRCLQICHQRKKNTSCRIKKTNAMLTSGCYGTVNSHARLTSNICETAVSRIANSTSMKTSNHRETAIPTSNIASNNRGTAISTSMINSYNSGTATSTSIIASNNKGAAIYTLAMSHNSGIANSATIMSIHNGRNAISVAMTASHNSRTTISSPCETTTTSALKHSCCLKTAYRNSYNTSITKSHYRGISAPHHNIPSSGTRATLPTLWGHAPSRRIHTIPPDIPGVTLLDMKRALKQKGVAVEDGYTALAVKCLLCEEVDPGTMYINKTTGYFLCPKCHMHGEWWLLERVLARGAAEERARDPLHALLACRRDFERAWRRLQRATRPLASLAEHDTRRLCELYDYPYYPECTKALAEVRCDEACTTLYFPLKNSLDTVVGYRKVEASRMDRPDNVGHHTAGLFSCRATRAGKAEQAVLVPTVADVLCLHKEKVPGSLVWWCEGALPPPLLPALEGFARVCVWGGAGSVRPLADKLRPERACFVRPVEGAGSAREAAAGGRALRALVAAAAPAAHRAITTFAALRDEVYANLVNADQVRGVKWSRFPALTKLLGGHRRGELTVLTGPTGCGKTTLTAEMSLDLATKGVITLWGSFEIRNARLAQTMLQQYAGVPLQEHLDLFPSLAADFERLPIYFLAFHGPQPIATVMEAVEHARYVHDIEHVIVDNVQFMLGVGGGAGGGGGGGGGERYFRQDEVVAAFRTLATRRDCHVTLVMHPRKEREADDLSTSSIFGSAKASQEADNVLIIQDKRLTAVRGKKFLQVAKNRFSGDLGVVPLEFDKAALSYQQRRRPPRDKAQQDDEHRQRGGERNTEGHRRDGGEQDLVEHGVDEAGYRQVDDREAKEHRQSKKPRDSKDSNTTGQKKQGDSFLSDVLDLDKGR